MRFCSTEISNIRVGKVYIEYFIIWGRNRCFAWMDSRQTRGNKRNRSLWGKNSKFLVTLDQPKSLIIKKGCFKAWLFTLNSSIHKADITKKEKRKLAWPWIRQSFAKWLNFLKVAWRSVKLLIYSTAHIQDDKRDICYTYMYIVM